MNMLFTTSFSWYRKNIFLPYGASLVATNAKLNGFNIIGMNYRFGESKELFIKNLKTTIIEHKIDIVCLSAMSAEYKEIKELIYYIKNLGCLTILGGGIVNYSHNIVPQNIGADFCLQGECEYSFIELVKILESNTNGIELIEKLRNVPGLYYNGEQIGRFDIPLYIDKLLDIIIDPVISNLSEYFKYGQSYIVFMSRSCPFNCTFCVNDGKTPYRKKEIDVIIREIQFYLEKFPNQIKSWIFWEELFDFSPSFINIFSEKIKCLRINFFVQTRATGITEDSIKTLKDAGLKGILIGLENVDNRVLHSMRKKTSIEMYKEKIEICNKYNIFIMGSIIVGDPEDDMLSLQKNVIFYKEYLNKIKMTFNKVLVFPSTDLYRIAQNRGLIKDELTYLINAEYSLNLSKIPDNIYDGLDNYFADIFLGAHHLASFIINGYNLTIDGNINISFICTNCFKTATIVEHDDFTTWQFITRICPNCGSYYSTGIFDHFFKGIRKEEVYETFFNKYQNKKIAIYGINHAQIKKALLSSQTLRKCLVACVDTNYSKFERIMFNNIKFNSPLSLKSVSFDFIIIGSVNSRREIICSIDKMGISANIIEDFPFVDKLMCCNK